MVDPCCATCRFGKRNGGGLRFECHRRAPVLGPSSTWEGSDGHMHHAASDNCAWPPVSQGGWCGEFEAQSRLVHGVWVELCPCTDTGWVVTGMVYDHAGGEGTIDIGFGDPGVEVVLRAIRTNDRPPVHFPVPSEIGAGLRVSVRVLSDNPDYPARVTNIRLLYLEREASHD